jgi:hypothetical protein
MGCRRGRRGADVIGQVGEGFRRGDGREWYRYSPKNTKTHFNSIRHAFSGLQAGASKLERSRRQENVF